MIDWKEFAELVRRAHYAQGDVDIDENNRQHAATFAALGMAILDLMARFEASSNKSVLISTTGEHLDRAV